MAGRPRQGAARGDLGRPLTPLPRAARHNPDTRSSERLLARRVPRAAPKSGSEPGAPGSGNPVGGGGGGGGRRRGNGRWLTGNGRSGACWQPTHQVGGQERGCSDAKSKPGASAGDRLSHSSSTDYLAGWLAGCVSVACWLRGWEGLCVEGEGKGGKLSE